MDYEITGSTSSPLVTITLDKGQSVKIENGSMVHHTPPISLEGKMNGGGFFKSIGRALTSGESFFVTTATSSKDNSSISIAPSSIGNIKALEVGPQQWVLNDGAFLASDTTVDYSVKRVTNIASSFLGQSGGLFNMVTYGSGDIIINGFGDIIELNLENESITVDNGHALAWDSSLSFDMKIASGIFGFKTGEGLAINFSGTGKVYIQTRQLPSFASSLQPYITTSSS